MSWVAPFVVMDFSEVVPVGPAVEFPETLAVQVAPVTSVGEHVHQTVDYVVIAVMLQEHGESGGADRVVLHGYFSSAALVSGASPNISSAMSLMNVQVKPHSQSCWSMPCWSTSQQ